MGDRIELTFVWRGLRVDLPWGTLCIYTCLIRYLLLKTFKQLLLFVVPLMFLKHNLLVAQIVEVHIRARWEIKINISFPGQLFLTVKLNFRNILFYDNKSFSDSFLCKFARLCFKGKYQKIQRKFPRFFKRLFLFEYIFLRTNVTLMTPPNIPPILGGRQKTFLSNFFIRIWKWVFKYFDLSTFYITTYIKWVDFKTSFSNSLGKNLKNCI